MLRPSPLESKSYAIPYLPHKVDVADLYPNGKLESDEQIEAVKAFIADSKSYVEKPTDWTKRRFTKRELKEKIKDIKTPVTEMADELFAIYKGSNELGAGTNGRVKLAQQLITGEWAVIKIIGIDSFMVGNADVEDRIQHEAEMIKAILGCYREPYHRMNRHKRYQFEIIMPLVRGVPMDLISKNSHINLSPLNWLKIAKNMMEATKNLHQENIYHRDIKPANFICNFATFECMLVDYAYADLIKKCIKATSIIGTPLCMAPEISNMVNVIDYNEQTEVFALGVTIAAVIGLEAEAAYNWSLEFTDMSKIAEGLLFRKRITDPQTRTDLLHLLKAMTTKDPAKRLTLQAAILQMQHIESEHVRRHENDTININTVAYLNMDDYLSAKLNPAEFKQLQDKLESAHVVQLISDKEDPYTSMLISHEFEKAGFFVFDRVMKIMNPANVEKEMTEYNALLEDKYKMKYHILPMKESNILSVPQQNTVQAATDPNRFFSLGKTDLPLEDSKLMKETQNPASRSLATASQALS